MQPVVQVFKVNTSKCRNPILSSGNTKSRLANNLPTECAKLSYPFISKWFRKLRIHRFDSSVISIFTDWLFKEVPNSQSMWKKSRDSGWLRRLFTKAHLFIHGAQKNRIQLSVLKNAQSFSTCSFNFTFERETSMPLHFLHFEKRNRGE